MPRRELRPVVAAHRFRHLSFRHNLLQLPVTRRPAKLVSTSSAKHSRVYTSSTLNTRNFLPLSAAS
jgi:hypothetical protein